MKWLHAFVFKLSPPPFHLKFLSSRTKTHKHKEQFVRAGDLEVWKSAGDLIFERIILQKCFFFWPIVSPSRQARVKKQSEQESPEIFFIINLWGKITKTGGVVFSSLSSFCFFASLSKLLSKSSLNNVRSTFLCAD